jgi:cobalt/nickel transport system permease protein
MDIIVYSDIKSPIHAIDPRVRILSAVLLTLPLTQAQDSRVLLAGILLGIAALALGRVPIAAILQRLVPLNALLLLLVAMLVFSVPGEAAFQIGEAVASRLGLAHGGAILLKSNAIVMLLASLVGTIEFVALGRALGQLRVPAKLVNILLFTVRYINLMLAEYERLSQAALLRGFRPGPNRHTMRTTGYLIGMMLVRSYDRGNRMLQAMKLRGYKGALSMPGGTRVKWYDHAFLAGVLGVMSALIGLEYS